VATLTIRGLDDGEWARLRARAPQNGRSMEDEVLANLREVLSEPAAETGLGSRIAARFAALDGVALDAVARDEMPRAAHLDS
jgi:plasmid stability protein